MLFFFFFFFFVFFFFVFGVVPAAVGRCRSRCCTNLFIPLFSNRLALLVTSRFVLGLSEGVMLPCALHLISMWFPESERTRALCFVLSGVEVRCACLCAPAPVPVRAVRARSVVVGVLHVRRVETRSRIDVFPRGRRRAMTGR